MDEFANPTTKPEIQQKLSEWSSKINELKGLSAQILKLDLKIQEGGDENLPFFLMLRNTIELLDGIRILVNNSSIHPCKPLLRALLENYFNLEYLLKENTKRRAYQFIGTYYYSKLKFYKKLENTSSTHSSYKKAFENDKRIGGYPFSQPPQLQQAIKNLESLFAKKEYNEIKNELIRLKKEEGNKNPKWFRLFGGPKTILGIANETRLEGIYNTYYRWWSGHVHGTNIIDGNFSADTNGKLEVLQIRLPFQAQEITNISITIGLYIIQQYVNYRIPTKKELYLNWNSKNREFYKQISGKNTSVNADKQSNDFS